MVISWILQRIVSGYSNTSAIFLSMSEITSELFNKVIKKVTQHFFYFELRVCSNLKIIALVISTKYLICYLHYTKQAR